MPIYDYKCKACFRIFEISKGMNENVDVICPFCESKDTHRVFSTVMTIKNIKDNLNSSGREKSSSGCDTCTSGVCSSCRHK